MKIVLVAAGSGAMYCGACARDGALARTFIELGHEAVVIPLYTPMRLEHELGLPVRPILFGGVNAYLREVVPGYTRWPSWFQRALDRPGVLSFASRFAVRTKAADLGPMTVSVIKGQEGKHAEEISRVARIVAAEKPDVVIVANSLLVSLVPALRQSGSFKIVCQVQGEDGFIDELPEPWKSEALSLIRKQIEQVDLLLAPCASHAKEMSERLLVPLGRFAIVSHATAVARALPFPSGRPTIGHLSAMRHAKGLDILIRALDHLPSDVRLVVAGKALEPDFQKEVRRLAVPFGDRLRFLAEIATAEKEAFFASVDLLALPSRLKESRARVAFEALACGRPVVAPRVGLSAELASMTPAVVAYEPNEPLSLSKAILGVLERSEAQRLGALGLQTVQREFAPDVVARQAQSLLDVVGA